MTTTEIKKLLYKQKPNANFITAKKGFLYYDTQIINLLNEGETVFFKIPFDDMGDADFTPIMDAKLLGRWILETNLENQVTTEK